MKETINRIGIESLLVTIIYVLIDFIEIGDLATQITRLIVALCLAALFVKCDWVRDEKPVRREPQRTRSNNLLRFAFGVVQTIIFFTSLIWISGRVETLIWGIVTIAAIEAMVDEHRTLRSDFWDHTLWYSNSGDKSFPNRK